MQTVKTLKQAYKHFKPYNPHRDSETVVINAKGRVYFFHWDKFLNQFEVEDGPNRSRFRGELINQRH